MSAKIFFKDVEHCAAVRVGDESVATQVNQTVLRVDLDRVLFLQLVQHGRGREIDARETNEFFETRLSCVADACEWKRVTA